MPIKYGNKERVFTVNEYRKVYTERHPDRIAQKRNILKRKPQTTFKNMLFLWLVLIAVNIMSGAHTVPTIQRFYDIDQKIVLAFIGIAGFLGVEGTLIVFNAQTKRSNGIKVVLLLTLVFAIAVNVIGAIIGVQTNLGNNGVFIGVGVLIGIIVPLVNIFAGEVIRHHSIERNEELNAIEKEYKEDDEKAEQLYREEQANFEKGLLDTYRRYLKKVFGKDVSEEVIMEFISGVAEAEADAEPNSIVIPLVEEILPKKKVTSEEIRNFIKLNPDARTGEIAKEFGISAARVSQIKNAGR